MFQILLETKSQQINKIGNFGEFHPHQHIQTSNGMFTFKSFEDINSADYGVLKNKLNITNQLKILKTVS